MSVTDSARDDAHVSDAAPSERAGHGNRLKDAGQRLLAWAKSPLCWIPLSVYVVSRTIVYFMVMRAQQHQMAMTVDNPYVRMKYNTPESPGYNLVMSSWDAQWYYEIATQGYPTELPIGAYDQVHMNAWAFFPVWPFLVRAFMEVTGQPFWVVAPALSLIIGAIAIVLLFRFIDEVVGRWPAIITTVATCFFFTSPVLSMAYTESSALLLVVLILMMTRARRYWVVAVLLVVMALTRNIVVAMAPVIIAHAVVRWRQTDEGENPVRFRIGMGLLAVWAGCLTWLWPLIAEIRTGVPQAYQKTLEPWGIEATEIKLAQWWTEFHHWMSLLGHREWGGAAMIAFIIGYAALMFSPLAFRWGPEIWGWAGAYIGYMLLAMKPTYSIPRYLIVAFPFALVLSWIIMRVKNPIAQCACLGVVAGVGSYLMWLWIRHYVVIEVTTLSMLYP